MIRVKSTEAAVPMAKAAETRDLDIDLPNIRPDQSAQPRENLHNDRIAEYAESMKAGDQFPPLTVFHDGEVYWLADGFHRFYAAQHAGRKHIRCYVRQGGLREAILYSVGANAKHGLARSDADKERAVLRLLNDAEWSTWTDRDIAKRCVVSHPFVAKVRKAHAGVTGNVSSERTYTTKHGTTATMKTAGINASRTQFQAKASEDNGSITGGAGAVTGEASRLASGRTDAGEVASVDLPTNQQETADEPGAGSQPVPSEGSSPRADVSIGVTGGESAAANLNDASGRNIFDELVSLWKEADAGVRQDFKAYITGSEFVAKFNHTEGNPAPGTGGTDVDRSAKRASSAVEVGATNSPDGAHTGAVTGWVDPPSTKTGSSDLQDAILAETNGVTRVAAGETAQVPVPEQSGDERQSDRQQTSLRQPDGAVHGWQDGQAAAPDHAPNSNPQPKTPGDADKAEAVTPPPAVSANPFTNPRCQKPETCHLAHSRNECFDCTMAWAKRPKDEQIRLWAEAIQAARAA